MFNYSTIYSSNYVVSYGYCQLWYCVIIYGSANQIKLIYTTLCSVDPPHSTTFKSIWLLVVTVVTTDSKDMTLDVAVNSAWRCDRGHHCALYSRERLATIFSSSVNGVKTHSSLAYIGNMYTRPPTIVQFNSWSNNRFRVNIRE